MERLKYPIGCIHVLTVSCSCSDRMNASAFEPTHLEPPPTVETVIPAPEIDSVGRSKFTYKLRCTNYAVQRVPRIGYRSPLSLRG